MPEGAGIGRDPRRDVQHRLAEAEGWIIVGEYERAAELTSEATALLRAFCAGLAHDAAEAS